MATILNMALQYFIRGDTAFNWKMPCMLHGLFVQRVSSFQKYWILEFDTLNNPYQAQEYEYV